MHPRHAGHPQAGEPAEVATSLVVREDSLTLYGFSCEDERKIFEPLQTASGVGPRLALAMLAVHAPDALRRAVATEDLGALTMVPGIGKKGAQRIVLEMKDGGLPGDSGDGRPARAAPRTPWRDQVQSGLVNLGWPAGTPTWPSRPWRTRAWPAPTATRSTWPPCCAPPCAS